MPGKPAQLVLATSDEVQRATLEAALLRAGFAVRQVGSVDEALGILGEGRTDFLVTDLGLAGGGAFSLARAVREAGNELPVIGLADRVIDADVRAMAGDCGIDVLVEPPIFAGRLTAAIGQAAARLADATGGPMRGSLAQWSVADLLRYAESHGWTGRLTLHTEATEATIWLTSGQPIRASAGSLTGGPALQTTLGWTRGCFELARSEAAAAERNIHQQVSHLLTDALPRLTQQAPGRARRTTGPIEEYVPPAAAVAGGGITAPERTTTPVAQPRLAPAPEPEPEEPAVDPGIGVTGDGRTWRRKLELRPIEAAEPAAPEELLIEELDQRRQRTRLRMILATTGTIVLAVVLMWWAMSGDGREVEVQVLDEVQETVP